MRREFCLEVCGLCDISHRSLVMTKKSSHAFLWVIFDLQPKTLNFPEIYILANENTLGYVIRKGSASLLFCKIRPKIAQYSGANLLSLSLSLQVDCEVFREEAIKMLQKRYVVARLKFAHCSGGEESEFEMTHMHISNRSGLTALKSKLQMILPYVQILPSVCKHLLVTSVGATYREAGFVSPGFITRRGCCRSRKKDCLLCESPHTNSCDT